MFRCCEDNTYIIVIVLFGWVFITFKDNIVLCDFSLHCGLAITVIERLQRYNCIWLTYIVNVERNILFYIKV